MEFNGTSKLADIIHRNYLLLPVLNRFGIQLGFGDKTVNDLCMEKKLNTDFVLVILNSFHDQEYFPQEILVGFDLDLILDYIKKSHKYYLELKIPQIEDLIKRVYDYTGDPQQKHLDLIVKFFSEYKTELFDHIQDEENNIYPYITTINRAVQSHKIEPAHREMIENHAIQGYAEKHENVEDKLYDLKNIIIKYLPPIEENTLSNTLLIELFRLERDLNDHARIEDKVLIPKVQQIENAIHASLR